MSRQSRAWQDGSRLQADILVTHALEFAQRAGAFALGEAERAYVARTSARDAYRRAMQTCHATRAGAAAEVAGRQA
jgi:glutathione S-transferase